MPLDVWLIGLLVVLSLASLAYVFGLKKLP
jgi:hypothetical protein